MAASEEVSLVRGAAVARSTAYSKRGLRIDLVTVARRHTHAHYFC